MDLRKEIRRTIREVRIGQEVNVKIEFRPLDDGSNGFFFMQEDNEKGLAGASFEEAMEYFATVLKEMKSNSL